MHSGANPTIPETPTETPAVAAVDSSINSNEALIVYRKAKDYDRLQRENDDLYEHLNQERKGHREEVTKLNQEMGNKLAELNKLLMTAEGTVTVLRHDLTTADSEKSSLREDLETANANKDNLQVKLENAPKTSSNEAKSIGVPLVGVAAGLGGITLASLITSNAIVLSAAALAVIPVWGWALLITASAVAVLAASAYYLGKNLYHNSLFKPAKTEASNNNSIEQQATESKPLISISSPQQLP